MRDQEEREELISVLEKIAEMARNTLECDNVLPESISLNGNSVGITIKFRKVDLEKESLDAPTNS